LVYSYDAMAIFGGSTLGIYGVMGVEKSDATVHLYAPARTGRTVRRLYANCPHGPGSHACG
jgi:hypothetical protein